MKENWKYKLSIIIVNYNVEYFLDQCLSSVQKAIENVNAEVIIVDNDSVDGSLKMLSEKYPAFKLIANKENVGFSRANNQAIQESSGEYILLLNPDTVVSEDTFEITINFMDTHENSGGLGVRMIDGKGVFLPESKRGLPKPLVAFYKIFGLSSLFPKSKIFGQYHLGHLPENETNQIDILSGAFMLMRKEMLNKVGLLDENFFMYGEDIDLSYRITQAGYDNYYCADTSIIHYKGESTKKSSVNYVFVFYRAMIIFAKKHFAGKNAWLFSFLINIAIYLRAFLSIVTRISKQLFLPIIDALYVIGGLYALTNYWRMASIEFPTELIKYSIPIYALTWVSSAYFNGGYDYPIKLFKSIKGILLATLLILITYAILPKSWQFSRLFIFIGAGWLIAYYILSRVFLHFAIGKRFNLNVNPKKKFGIVANKSEYARIKSLLNQTGENIQLIANISLDAIRVNDSRRFDEIIFSTKDCTNAEIIATMGDLANPQIDFKISQHDTDYLIGSNSIHTAGDLYILNINNLISKENKRKKRLFDFMFSLAFIIALPILLFLFRNRSKLLKNLFHILIGKKSFIGFSDEVSKRDVRLPKIKPAILSPSDGIDAKDSDIKEKLNLLYSRDYSMRKDFSILLKSWRYLDK